MYDENFSGYVWNEMVEWNKDRPHHYMRGWSGEGYCAASILIGHIYHIPFHPGRTLPGTLLHLFSQEDLFPMGTKVMGRYYIVAHEVPVFVKINGHMRWSYIDTLVYDAIDKEFEVWDYKAAGFAKYRKKDPKKPHILQVNLYAYLFGASRYRIIYVDKINYEGVYAHIDTVDEEMAKNFITRMEMLDRLKKGEYTEVPYSSLCEELYKNPQKSQCSWCNYKKAHTDVDGKLHSAYCKKLIEKEVGETFESWSKARKYLIEEAKHDS